MEYENDFVIEESINLDIKGYPLGAFKYKPTNAGMELDWLPEYMIIDESNKPRPDFAKLNKLKLKNLVSVPYDQETINKVIKIDKAWDNLSIEERWTLLRKLKGTVFDKILNAIKQYDLGDVEAKKA